MKYLTFVNNINIFNLKNHQVLKLKFRSIKHWQWICSRGGPTGPGPTGPPLGSDRVKIVPILSKKLNKSFDG